MQLINTDIRPPAYNSNTLNNAYSAADIDELTARLRIVRKEELAAERSVCVFSMPCAPKSLFSYNVHGVMLEPVNDTPGRRSTRLPRTARPWPRGLPRRKQSVCSLTSPIKESARISRCGAKPWDVCWKGWGAMRRQVCCHNGFK